MQIYRFLSALVVIVLLPGCYSRYYFWGKEQFVQASKVRIDLADARSYLQTKRIYDQAATVGIFDVLWLNHVVRSTYAKLYAARKGLSGKEQQNFFEKHQEEMQDTLSFYVLMDNDSEHRLDMKVQETNWSIYLALDDKIYHPKYIKPVFLVPEYKKIFGYRSSPFRAAYLVAFDEQDKNGISLLDGLNTFTLTISSVNHKVSFTYS